MSIMFDEIYIYIYIRGLFNTKAILKNNSGTI